MSRGRGGFAAAILALAAPAQAHSPIEGLNDFYAGALHPFLAPAHLVVLLALGLAIGQHAQPALARAKPPLLALLLALPLGLATHRLAGDPDTDRALLGLAAALGLAVAAQWRAPAAALAVLTVAIALNVGWGSGPGGVGDRERVLALAGTAASVLLLVTYVAVIASHATRPALRVATRVAGSWLAATALLVLALSFAQARA